MATYNGSTYVIQATTNFLYDGWNLIATLNPQASLLNSFVWGSDLSGSMQGAGGVGGLLEVSYHGSVTTNCFPAFDGNGNVAALVNAANGTEVANYEYGPFGEVIRQTGPMAKANPLRFSTKYQDDESDLLYYGYRYYKASTGTWSNRDPIYERGGINVYAYIKNNPLNGIDLFGMAGCGEFAGPHGHPEISFASAGSKWVGTVSLDDEEGTAEAQSINEINLTWRAKVIVLCNCPCGIRKGTRIVGPFTAQGTWLVYDVTQTPLDLPLASGILDFLGQLGGSGIQSVIGGAGLVAAPDTIQQMGSAVAGLGGRPSNPWDGSWEGGKSPCDK